MGDEAAGLSDLAAGRGYQLNLQRVWKNHFMWACLSLQERK
jgi:hypothetical protein